MEFVQAFAKSKMLYESMGASPFGGDTNKWPGRMFDAFVILQEEHKKVEMRKTVIKDDGKSVR